MTQKFSATRSAAGVLLVLFALSAGAPALAEDSKKKSVAEIARDLANPNTPLASITLKTQYRFYDGDLTDANDQGSTTLLFQPTLPPAEKRKDTVRPTGNSVYDQTADHRRNPSRPIGSDY